PVAERWGGGWRGAKRCRPARTRSATTAPRALSSPPPTAPRPHALYGIPLPPLCPPGRAAAGPVSWPAQHLRLWGIIRDERGGYGALYCRRYLLLAEWACGG